jgi:hypothetical protein
VPTFRSRIRSFVTVRDFSGTATCYAGLKDRERSRLCKNAGPTRDPRHSTFQNARYGIFSKSGVVKNVVISRFYTAWATSGQSGSSYNMTLKAL